MEAHSFETMASDISRAFQENLACLVCLNYLTDPVTVDCGHSFCRPCLCLSWQEASGPAQCPVCRKSCQQRSPRNNDILRKLVSVARQASLRRCLSSREHLCVIHEEPKMIFCEEDKMLLCPLCSTSPEHKAHRLGPAEAAAEDQRDMLLAHMASLWEKIEENERNLNEESNVIVLWMDYVSLREAMIRAEYRKLHPALCEEQKQHVELLRNEGQWLLQKLRESEAMMIQNRRVLRELYQELATMCHEPCVQLLQNQRDIWTRSKSVQWCMPKLVKPALSARPITGLADTFDQFRVEISFQDVIIAHHSMRLFDSMRNLNFRHTHGEVSVDSDASYFSFWGDECFTSGKYYWELDVEDSWDWALGVCKDSWQRKSGPVIESENVFLLICVNEGNHYSLLSTSPSFPHYVEKPSGRVGVFLDCDNGHVSFLNVAKNSLIWRYPACSFHFPVRPFFSTGHP